MSNSKPSIVIVPGAWHQPEAYETLVAQLNDAGYLTIAVSLPNCDSKTPETSSCAVDVEAVRKQILVRIEDEEEDVLVICHSYGGLPAGGAASGLSKNARIKAGKKAGIIGLVYMAAFIVPEKSILLETFGGTHPPYVTTNQPLDGLSTVADPKNVFYNDLDKEHAQHLTGLLRPFALGAFNSIAPPPAWAEAEFAGTLTYLRCLKDQALPPSLQDWFVQRSGVEWKVEDIEASHSPFASKPKELVEIVGELVRKSHH